MRKEEYTFLSADGKTNIHAIKWIPADGIKAVLQICHGMAEHIDRYDDFACFMAEHGFLVTGNDHLGHGASVRSDKGHGFFGHPDGNRNVIADIHQLRMLTLKELRQMRAGKAMEHHKDRDEDDPDARKADELPYFMLGHSMGSFLLRQYLAIHGDGLSGAVIMGTGYQPSLVLKTGKAVCRVMSVVKGWDGQSDFVDKLTVGGYAKKIKGARTQFDWLTKVGKIVDDYSADPWCGYKFKINGYYQMFKGMQTAHDQKMIRRTPKELPILIVSGDEDPVGSFGKGVRKVLRLYRKLGFTDAKMKLYHGDRHEILNEKDNKIVYGDLLEWMQVRMQKKSSRE